MSAQRASLFVLGMAAFMVQADARVIDPLLHVISRDFHTTPPAAAVVISAYALPYGLFQLLYGPVGDRVGKIRVMAACLTVFSFGTFACAFVPSIPVFATLRFLTGVVAAAVIPMSLGYIGDTFPYQDRQIALGRFMSALMIGQIVGSTLGGVFGEYLGWRYIFVVFGVVSLVVSALLAREAKHSSPSAAARPLGPQLLTARRVLDLRRPAWCAAPGDGDRAGGGRRMPARLCAGHAVRKHADAPRRAPRARHRAARRTVRIRRPRVSRVVAH
jgi:predicted MFS family arabinose efflux permease